MTGHKQKVNILDFLICFPFSFVLDYLLVEGFSRTRSSFDVLKMGEAVYRLTPGQLPKEGACSVAEFFLVMG